MLARSTPYKDLDMNPMHYVCPLEQAGIQESMWLLILLSFCCLSSDPSSKIVTRTWKTEQRSANLTLRGCTVPASTSTFFFFLNAPGHF